VPRSGPTGARAATTVAEALCPATGEYGEQNAHGALKPDYQTDFRGTPSGAVTQPRLRL
jgi:hypothetical protein